MCWLAVSAAFEYMYLYSGSMAIIMFNSFSAGTDFRREILTSKIDLRAERVDPALVQHTFIYAYGWWTAGPNMQIV